MYKDWIPKWEAKVVMATVTKVQTLEFIIHTFNHLSKQECMQTYMQHPVKR